MTTKTILAAACLCVAIPAQLHWSVQSTGPRPPAEGRAVLAHSSNPLGLLWFGGVTTPQTWHYAAGVWTQLRPAHQPNYSDAAAMTYDAARDQVVYVSSTATPTQSFETWIWDGTDWVQRFPQTSPPVRGRTAMAFESRLGEVLLFGGSGVAPSPLDDTWLWNGTDWRLAQTLHKPSGRSGHAMCPSPVYGVLLHGGRDDFGALNDLWAFDSTDWRRIVTPTPGPSRLDHSLTYDEDRRRYILHGGSTFQASLDETWELNPQGWRPITLGLPGPDVRAHVAGFDPIDLKVMVHGGQDVVFGSSTPFDATATLAPTVRATFRHLALAGCGGHREIMQMDRPILGSSGFGILSAFPTIRPNLGFVALLSSNLRASPLQFGPCSLYLDDPIVSTLPAVNPAFLLPLPEDPSLRGLRLVTQILGGERFPGEGHMGVGITRPAEFVVGD